MRCVTEFNLDFHTSKSARCGTSEKEIQGSNGGYVRSQESSRG